MIDQEFVKSVCDDPKLSLVYVYHKGDKTKPIKCYACPILKENTQWDDGNFTHKVVKGE